MQQLSLFIIIVSCVVVCREQAATVNFDSFGPTTSRSLMV